MIKALANLTGLNLNRSAFNFDRTQSPSYDQGLLWAVLLLLGLGLGDGVFGIHCHCRSG